MVPRGVDHAHLAMSSERRAAELPRRELALRSGGCCWLTEAIQDCQSHLYAEVQARGLVRMALTHEWTALADRLVELHVESSFEMGWLAAGCCGAGGGVAAGVVQEVQSGVVAGVSLGWLPVVVDCHDWGGHCTCATKATGHWLPTTASRCSASSAQQLEAGPPCAILWLLPSKHFLLAELTVGPSQPRPICC
jgi:hypothetical protein